MTERMKKLVRAAQIILPQSEQETQLDKLVASSLQAGYELGKYASSSTDEEQQRRLPISQIKGV